MHPGHRQRIEQACARGMARADFLPGGCVGEVWKITFDDGSHAVAKTAAGDSTLDIEAYMLRYLADHSDLPVPGVIEGAKDLLVIDYVENSSGMGPSAQEHAADLLAALHQVTAPRYGHERDTLIGPLRQPNPWTERWHDFYREQRLFYMGREALETGGIGMETYERIERLGARLAEFLPEGRPASLLHGDCWGGNVLTRGNRIAAFIDPAIYHGDAEEELAYTTLFNTFGPRFFDRYREHNPLEPGFFETRVPLYTLYSLLVHARLFGGGYGTQADTILRRYVG
ncbi:fructosamine-3-kinase [Aestuariispira insulae]|uniref:Fructosamine-3-kinase n=2 Tax=Aestuariispira insulae TaxID=1461337 RepID=A0A3D9HP53_9PROT|nr:fructosamine-3-kinase [Aestuariispira insulae]